MTGFEKLVDTVTATSILTEGVPQLPDLTHLSHAEKDALIRALWQRLEAAERRIADLEARLGEPGKTPDNSSLPPSKGQKPNQSEKARRVGPRTGSLGRKGGGRPLACDPDETVVAKPACCAHCQAALRDADQVLHGRYDKVDIPVVRPMVTRVERYAGHCPCCGGITLAAIPTGLENGSPFSVNIVALAIYLRFTHAISYRRLTRLFLHLYALQISEGALDAMLQRAKHCFDSEVVAILARLRRSRIVCSDETSVRIDGRTHWNWVFQNDQVVIHVVRNSRAASVVTETMQGHRPSAAAHDPGREHPVQLSATVGSRVERDHGSRAHQQPRQTAAQTLWQGAQPFVHFPRASGGSAGQQRQREGIAAHRHISQSHRWVPVQMGRRSVRWRSIRHWYRRTTGNRCVSSYSRCPRRGICHSAGLSRYLATVSELWGKGARAGAPAPWPT